MTADLTQDFSDALACLHTVIYTAGSAETEGANEERLIDRDAIQTAADYSKQHAWTALS